MSKSTSPLPVLSVLKGVFPGEGVANEVLLGGEEEGKGGRIGVDAAVRDTLPIDDVTDGSNSTSNARCLTRVRKQKT